MKISESTASPSRPRARPATGSSRLWLHIGAALVVLGGAFLLGLLQGGTARTAQDARAAPTEPTHTAGRGTTYDARVPDAAPVWQDAGDEAPAPQAY